MSDISTTLLREAKEMRKDRPHLRKGQTMFLVAFHRYPDIVAVSGDTKEIEANALDTKTRR